jgi:hypothetical protein
MRLDEGALDLLRGCDSLKYFENRVSIVGLCGPTRVATRELVAGGND